MGEGHGRSVDRGRPTSDPLIHTRCVHDDINMSCTRRIARSLPIPFPTCEWLACCAFKFTGVGGGIQ